MSHHLFGAAQVLTTYPVVENEWRRQIDKHKVPCKHCARLFLPRSASHPRPKR